MIDEKLKKDWADSACALVASDAKTYGRTRLERGRVIDFIGNNLDERFRRTIDEKAFYADDVVDRVEGVFDDIIASEGRVNLRQVMALALKTTYAVGFDHKSQKGMSDDLIRSWAHNAWNYMGVEASKAGKSLQNEVPKLVEIIEEARRLLKSNIKAIEDSQFFGDEAAEKIERLLDKEIKAGNDIAVALKVSYGKGFKVTGAAPKKAGLSDRKP